MTTPAGGIEPHTHDWHIWPETDGQEQKCVICGAYRRTPEEDKFWLRASTATASPQSTKVQRVYFHRYGTPGIEDHIDIPLRDDPRRHVDHALIHRVLLVPSEHLIERSALQPEAPCEDTEIECPRCSEVFYLSESKSTAVPRPVDGDPS